MTACRICQSPLDAFMSFGQMPIANGFLTPEQYDDEYFFPLEPAFCDACSTFQIIEQPDPKQLFHENYAFYSRTSKAMAEHFHKFGHDVIAQYLTVNDPFVVEIGSNDGILLECFAKAGIKHLGCEPSANVANVASQYGITTLTSFFGESSATHIKQQYGPADAILAANVICHIPDLHDIGRGLQLLLKPNGVFIFEEPYIGDVLQKVSFDQIYDEHVYLFSLYSVNNIFSKHGLEVIDVIPQTTHGGSMRYILAKQGTYPISKSVQKLAEQEQQLGLNKIQTYTNFKHHCETIKEQLVSLLTDIKSKGLRIAGYGATAKSTTLMNYCGINNQLIDFITDTTPIKQNKYTPGGHIPIVDHQTFIESPPDYTVLFAWNHKDEIFAKEQQFTSSGGQWIMYVPQVAVITP